MYGVLANRIAVCAGYTKAYSYLLDKVGIISRYCESAKLDHAWNIVFIDGKEYYVDVTWDDPTNDITGRVDHKNFLRSTDGIISTGDESTDFEIIPDNTLYDDCYWQNSNSEFQLLNGNIYYIDNTEQKLKMTDGTHHIELCDLTDKWYLADGRYWTANYARLSGDGNNLYYSLAKSVYRYDIANKTAEVIFTPDLPDGFNIFGFTYEDGKLVCDTNDEPQFKPDTKKQNRVTFSYTPPQTSVSVTLFEKNGITYISGLTEKTPVDSLDIEVFSKNGQKKTTGYIGTGDRIVSYKNGVKNIDATAIIPGDVDGDGKISATDYVKIRLALLKRTTFNDAQYQAACVTGGKSITVRDYVMLRLHILGRANING